MSTLQSPEHGAAQEYPPLPPVTGAARARALAVAAVGPIFIGYAAIAALLALVTALSSGPVFSTSGVLAAAGPAWLAAWHVPIEITGQELGVLPLLPTVLLMLLTARAATNAADRLEAATPAESLPILSTIGGAHAVIALAIAVLDTHPGLANSPALSFFVSGALSTLAAAVGLSGRCGFRRAISTRADLAVLPGLRAGLVAGCTLLAASALLLTGTILGHWTATVHAFRLEAPGFGSGLGMLLLCLAYLPNVLVGTCAFLTGPGTTIGQATISPLAFHQAPVPDLPILAALPHHPAHWWPVLLILPTAAGALTAWQSHRTADEETPTPRTRHLRSVPFAALTVAIPALALAALSGGKLANGPYNPVTIPAGLFAALLFAGITIGGLTTTWFLTRPTPLPEEETDSYDAPTPEEPTTPENDPTTTPPNEPSDENESTPTPD